MSALGLRCEEQRKYSARKQTLTEEGLLSRGKRTYLDRRLRSESCQMRPYAVQQTTGTGCTTFATTLSYCRACIRGTCALEIVA